MSHVLRTVWFFAAIAQVGLLVLFLNTGAAPVFEAAYGLDYVVNGPWKVVLDRYRFIAYSLIVPLFLLNVVAYQMIGPYQDEREQRRQVVRRRY